MHITEQSPAFLGIEECRKAVFGTGPEAPSKRTWDELVRLKNEFRKYLVQVYYTGPNEPEPKPNPTTVLAIARMVHEAHEITPARTTREASGAAQRTAQ